MTAVATLHRAGNLPDAAWAPAFHTDPDDIDWDYSEGDVAIALANYAFDNDAHPGMTLDPWQEWLLREILAKHPETGRFRHQAYVISVGRQNGKSQLVAALSLYLLLAHHAEPNVIGVASNVDQAGIVYHRTAQLVNGKPDIRRRFQRTTETRGLLLAGGRGRYRVFPAKESALQGHSITGGIVDELHLLPSGAWNSLIIGAGQVPNSILVGITTAGDDQSALLLDLYARGRAGVDGLGFCVWEAPEGSKVDDLDALRAANPALACGRMDEDQVLREVRMLPEPDAVRYRLNRFITASNAWLPQGAWETLPMLDVDTPRRNVALVVDRTPDWSAATITASWMHDGVICTDVVASVVKPDLDKLVELCTVVATQVPHTRFMADGYALGELTQVMKVRGIKVDKLAMKDGITAASIAYQAITEGRVRHPHHPMVVHQLARTIRKNVQGSEAYRLTRPNTAVELDAAMATVLGIYAAATQPDFPGQVL